MNVWKTKSGYSIRCILPGRSNVFLLTAGEKEILIDTGAGMSRKKLVARLHGLGIKTIDLLILTHTHFDHASNATMIKRDFQAKVIVQKEEATYLRNGENSETDGTNFLTDFIVKKLVPSLKINLDYEPCEPDIITDQIFDLRDMGINGYILHTPGHTFGSQSIIIDDEIALVGDAMFGIFPGSIFPPFACDVDEMIRSWDKLLNTGCSFFLPSHGSPDSKALLIKELEKRKLKQ